METKRWESRYTLVLTVVAALHLLLIPINLFYQLQLFDGTVMFPHLGAYLTIIVFSGVLFVAAYSRHVGSTSARGLTAVASVIAAFFWPVGTAAFIYWVGWVRRREAVA